MATFSEYGEALAEAQKSQVELLTGTGDFASTGRLIDLIPLEEQASLRYAEAEQAKLDQLLKGKEQREVIGTEYVGGGKALTREDLGGYTIEPYIATEEGWWWRMVDPTTGEAVTNADGSTMHVFSADKNVAESGLVSLANKAGIKSKGYEQDVYGDIIGRDPGMMDLLTTTQARRFDPVTGEVSYGQAGFDPQQEFTGLGTAQAQTQAAQATIGRESDIADVEMLRDRAIEASRTPEMKSLLGQLGSIRQSGAEATGGIREGLLAEAQGLLGSGLTEEEKRKIREESRIAGVAAGRVRDPGRVGDEVIKLMEADRARKLEGLSAAQSLLGGEFAYQGQDFSKALGHLGAEKETSADPYMAILGRQGAPATTAGGMLSGAAGVGAQAGPQFLNPEAGLGYIGGREAAIGSLEAAKIGAKATERAGQYSAGGKIFESLFG